MADKKESKEIKFKAKNGHILIARDEVQAAAFAKAGLESMDKTIKQDNE